MGKIKFFLIFLFCIFFIISVKISSVWKTVLFEENTQITIASGDVFSNFPTWNIGEEISSFWFSFWLRFHTPDYVLQAGDFLIPAGVTVEKFFSQTLKDPIPEQETTITILPGWNMRDVLAYLTKKNFCNQEELGSLEKNILEAAQKKYAYLWGISRIDGLLVPDTYRIYSNMSCEWVFWYLIDAFHTQIYTSYFTGISDWYETAILASLVEREEKNKKNKSLVAGIILNRLDVPNETNGLLGIDAALCYEKRVLHNECLDFVNTYYSLSYTQRQEKKYQFDLRMHTGMPPFAISNFSKNTLESVLHPEKTSMLYYLHDTSGNIHVSRNLSEHNRNKNIYLR